MKLGEFAGITGAMLVLCYDKVPEEEINIIKIATGENAINTLERELVSLLCVRNYVKYTPNLSLESLGVSNGEWMNNGWTNAEDSDYVRKVFELTVQENLLNAGKTTYNPSQITEFLQKNDWEFLESAAKRCSKKNVGDVPIDVSHFSVTVPEHLNVNGEIIDVTDDIRTIILKLNEKYDLILDIIHFIKTEIPASIISYRVFGINAIQTLNYKPEYIYNAFVEMTKQSKKLKNEAAFKTFLSNIESEKRKLDLIDSHIYSGVNSRYQVNLESPNGISSQVWNLLSEELRDTITKLLDKDWSIPGIESDLNLLGQSLVDLYIYGINADTSTLIKRSVNSGFVADSEMKVTPEIKAKIKDFQNIVTAYLESQLAVGTEV